VQLVFTKVLPEVELLEDDCLVYCKLEIEVYICNYSSCFVWFYLSSNNRILCI